MIRLVHLALRTVFASICTVSAQRLRCQPKWVKQKDLFFLLTGSKSLKAPVIHAGDERPSLLGRDWVGHTWDHPTPGRYPTLVGESPPLGSLPPRLVSPVAVAGAS